MSYFECLSGHRHEHGYQQDLCDARLTEEERKELLLHKAAPEMLDVLKVYAEFDNCSNVDDRGTCTTERQCICCRARAAAAKAEGRQP